MQSTSRQPPLVSVLPGLALVILAVAGLVLASSWFTDYPASVLAAAWIIAIIAMITVAFSAWREARRTGLGYMPSLTASMKQLGRFVIDFF